MPKLALNKKCIQKVLGREEKDRISLLYSAPEVVASDLRQILKTKFDDLIKSRVKVFLFYTKSPIIRQFGIKPGENNIENLDYCH